MKIGILAGDFDPLHNGHINLINNFSDELSLDRVIILPRYCEPLGKGYAVSPSQHRLNMCRAAFSEKGNIDVSDIEIKRIEDREYEDEYEYEDGDISDSIIKIKDTYPDDDLYYLMGSDEFLTFRESCRWTKISDIAVIAVSSRNYDDDAKIEAVAAEMRSSGAEVMVIPIDVREISSSSVRVAVKNSDDISSVVPEGVSEYIWNNYLYYRD